MRFKPAGAQQHRVAAPDLQASCHGCGLHVGSVNGFAGLQQAAFEPHKIQQNTARKNRWHLFNTQAGRARGAADAIAQIAVVKLVVVPGVAQRIHMRANVQWHDNSVFGKLKTAGALAARHGIVATIAAHEMLQAAAVRRHRCFAGKQLRQA